MEKSMSIRGRICLAGSNWKQNSHPTGNWPVGWLFIDGYVGGSNKIPPLPKDKPG
jgi:hypothetical protein